MPYEPATHHRRSVRLQAFDYTATATYFLTICTHERRCLFGDIVDSTMRPNTIGLIVAEEWVRSTDLRPSLVLDTYVVMPNHVHGVVTVDGASRQIDDTEGLTPRRLPRSLGSFVGGFKSASTIRINQLRGTPGSPVWQRNYHEHIIRNEQDLDRIRQYIANNPAQWELDHENPIRARR